MAHRCPGCAPIHKLKVWKVNGRWYVKCLACPGWEPPRMMANPPWPGVFGRPSRELAQEAGVLHQKEMKV